MSDARLEALEEMQEVVAFLLGAGELTGHWYGDEPPGEAPYWWRRILQRRWERIRALTEPAGEAVAWMVEWKYAEGEQGWRPLDVLLHTRRAAEERARERPGYESRVTALYRRPE